MQNKIVWEETSYLLDMPLAPNLTPSGELYIVCPICTSSRKPHHQNEAKLAINMQNPNLPWRCNHCGAKGYVINEDTIKNYAVKPYLKDIKQDEEMRDEIMQWLNTIRMISKETVAHFGIRSSTQSMRMIRYPEGMDHLRDTYQEMPVLMIPYLYMGLLVDVKFRDHFKNFKRLYDAELVMYNMDAIRGQKMAIITEGEPDAWSWHEAGYPYVCSVPNGATISEKEREEYEKTGKVLPSGINLTYLDKCINDFKDCEIIYIATDNDASGVKLREQLARRLGKERCKYLDHSTFKRKDGTPCKDGNDVWIAHGKLGLDTIFNEAISFPQEGISLALDYQDILMQIYDEGVQKGLSTGYKSLDAHFKWIKGYLYVENGYPSMGKTVATINLMVIAAVLYGWKWGIYSPENYPIEDVIEMIAEIYLGNTIVRQYGDRVSKTEYTQTISQFVNKHFYFVEDREKGYTPDELRDIKKTMIRQYGIDGFFTDPWKNLVHIMNRVSIDDYIRDQLNKEVRFTIHHELINIISHHPPTPDKKKGYREPPDEFAMVGGQIWFASAYVQFCVHREDRTSKDNTFTNFIVQKVKNQKRAGIPTEDPVKLKFDVRTNRFLERENILDINSAFKKFPLDESELFKTQKIEGF